MIKNDMMDRTLTPSMEAIGCYVNNPLWEQICGHVEQQYLARPHIEYSGCSMQPGWNVKYRKAGRTLCTLYPMEGHFITLVVIGEQEREDTEAAFFGFTPYLQQLYSETTAGMGQKWLMIHVDDDSILEDVKQCIAIRGRKKR